MGEVMDDIEARRLFLRFLATSPIWAGLGSALFTDELFGSAQSTKFFAGLGDGLVASPNEAINVFDFEPVAKRALPPAHWGYMATGTDDDGTIQANRDGFTKFRLRPKRLVDVRQVDTSTQILGETWPTPIVIAPCGRQGAFHAEGELPVARAARAKEHLQILSNVTSTSVEEVIEARGAPVWFQLYPRYNWEVTRAMVDRAERAGCPAVVFTVDLQGGSNRETLKRFSKLDDRECTVCHAEDLQGYIQSKPMYDGLEMPETNDYERGLTWDFVKRLRDHTKMKVFVKGIVTREDSAFAVAAGIDGVVVSNHGGRAEASRRSTIESLPEVVKGADSKLTVLVDGGFRRGTDIFTALALGADAVCIGRPYLWGLASFGQSGVEAVLELLKEELVRVMRQMGTTSIDQISSASVERA